MRRGEKSVATEELQFRRTVTHIVAMTHSHSRSAARAELGLASRAVSPAASLADRTRSRPVFDAHADSLQLALDLGRDLGERGVGHLDLLRAREGGLGALVFVSWCDPRFIATGPHGARDRTRALLR